MSDAIPSRIEMARPAFRTGAVAPAPRRAVRRRSPLRRFVSSFLLLVLVVLLAIAADFARFALLVGGSERPADPRAEGIVALTGGAARIDGALTLLSANRAARLLISGVNPSVGRREIASTLDPDARGSLDTRVDLGHAARDTIGNADEARAWAEDHKYRSLIVVTSDYHMPRSMVELASAMPDVELIAYPIRNPQLEMERWWRHANSARLLLAEYLKYTLARARLVFESPKELHKTGPSATASAVDVAPEVLR